MPLNGITVIDIGTAVAGPYCTTILGELGARVIKVEKPKRGDLIRYTDRYIQDESGYFIGVNRGKQSVTIDLRVPEGQAIVRRLAREADILVENFRPGMMAKWGLDFEALKSENPKLIYCSMSAFPEAGGFETAAGNDITVQAYSGLMDLTGYSDGPPAKVGAPLVDTGTSMLGAIGVLAALRRRDQTGQGEHVSVSLLEAAYALMPNFIATELNSDHRFGRLGSGHPQLVPYQAFMCSDSGYVVVGAFHRDSWNRLCGVLGRDDIRIDPRFAENFDRVRNRASLIPILQGEILKKSRSEWLSLFEKAGVPCSPIFSLGESLSFFTERLPELVEFAAHKKLGRLKMLRFPIRFTDGPSARSDDAAPALGIDTDAVLTKLGYRDDEIAALRQKVVV